MKVVWLNPNYSTKNKVGEKFIVGGKKILANNEKSIGRWISILYRYGQCFLDKQLKPYHLGSGQFIFLAVLLYKDGISQENLANYLEIDKGTTARAIKKLEEEGYVIRKTDPNDKRANLVKVTNKALAIKPLLQQISQKWTKKLTIDFTQEEEETVIKLLERMAENAALLIKSKD